MVFQQRRHQFYGRPDGVRNARSGGFRGPARVLAKPVRILSITLENPLMRSCGRRRCPAQLEKSGKDELPALGEGPGAANGSLGMCRGATRGTGAPRTWLLYVEKVNRLLPALRRARSIGRTQRYHQTAAALCHNRNAISRALLGNGMTQAKP